jgi:hypothetical protein
VQELRVLLVIMVVRQVHHTFLVQDYRAAAGVLVVQGLLAVVALEAKVVSALAQLFRVQPHGMQVGEQQRIFLRRVAAVVTSVKYLLKMEELPILVVAADRLDLVARAS